VLTLAEAADYLRVSTEEVLRLIREQQLPGRQVGDGWRFLTTALQDWLRAPAPAAAKEAFWRTHFGALSGDPYLEDMLADIYKRRGRPETAER
jgi:excisionase family DNA binding protein